MPDAAASMMGAARGTKGNAATTIWIARGSASGKPSSSGASGVSGPGLCKKASVARHGCVQPAATHPRNLAVRDGVEQQQVKSHTRPARVDWWRERALGLRLLPAAYRDVTQGVSSSSSAADTPP